MARPRKGTPKDPERAKEAILDAAQRRFSERGYRGTRVSDVARDAGYSEALVFFHFGSKKDLFREVVNRIDAQTAWYDEAPTADTLVDQLQGGELSYHRDARWRALDRVWSEALAGESDLLAMVGPNLQRSLDRLAGHLARMDQVDHPDLDLLARWITAVSYGSRVMRRYDSDALSPEDAARLMAWTGEVVVALLGGRTPDPEVLRREPETELV